MFQSTSAYAHGKSRDIPISYVNYHSPANSDSTMGQKNSPSFNGLNISDLIDNRTEISSNGGLNSMLFSIQSTPKSEEKQENVLLPNIIKTPGSIPKPKANQWSNQEIHSQAEIERIAMNVFTQWRAKEKEQIRAEIRDEIIEELKGKQTKPVREQVQEQVQEQVKEQVKEQAQEQVKEQVKEQKHKHKQEQNVETGGPRIVSYNTELSLEGDANTAITSPMVSPKETSFIDLPEKLRESIKNGNIKIPTNILHNKEGIQENEFRKLKQQNEKYENTINVLSNELSKWKDMISEYKRENNSLKLVINDLYLKLEYDKVTSKPENKCEDTPIPDNSQFKNGHNGITQNQSPPQTIPQESGKSLQFDINSYPPEVRNRLIHINAYKLEKLSEQELRYILRNLMYVLMIDYDVIQSKSIKYAKFISMASKFIDSVHDLLYPNGGILRTGILLKCENNNKIDNTMERLNNCLHDMLENLTKDHTE